jgi:uncharacterized protein DUF3352
VTAPASTGRRRILALAALGAAVIVVVALIVLLTGSDGDGGRSDTAAKLVPPDAQLYMHAQIDEESDQWRDGQRLVIRLPSLRRLLEEQLARLGTGASPVELQARIRPWLGKEAALALLPGRQEATSLILLSVRDRAGAQSFLNSISRTPKVTRFRGIEVRRYGRLEAAFTGDPPYLAIGPPANVRAAIVATEGDSLGDDSTFRKATGRVNTKTPLLYAYAPGEGARRLLAAQTGELARLLRSFSTPGLAAAIVTAAPESDGLRLNYAEVLEPGAEPEATRAVFSPSIPDELGRNTIAYFGSKGVVRTLRLVSRVAGQRGSGLGPLLGPLLDSLGARGERELIAALEPLEDKETALVAIPPANAPPVTLVVSNVTQDESGELVASLQPLVERLIENPPSEDQVPTIQPDQVQGGDALTLQLTPSLSLTYAAIGGRLYVSSGGPGAINRLLTPRGSLSENPAFAPGMDDLLDSATAVVFLDLARLTSLAKQAGSLRSPELSALAEDLTRIGTLSVVTESQPTSQTAEIFAGVP